MRAGTPENRKLNPKILREVLRKHEKTRREDPFGLHVSVDRASPRWIRRADQSPASVAGSSSALIFSAKVLPSLLFSSPAFLNPSMIFDLASSGFSLM